MGKIVELLIRFQPDFSGLLGEIRLKSLVIAGLQLSPDTLDKNHEE